MSLALYRKHRPAAFTDLVGQDPIRTSLTQQVARGQFAHAYLFSGPRGVGKTSTARILARAVNCQHPKNGEPDNTCDFCKEILEGRSLDIIEIDAASNTGVDHVRDHIIENSRFTPQRLAYKVFIIDEVHMLSSSAFNALLKTLEEPPAHVLFIMATTEVHRVPETILSRCQRFDFQRLGIKDLIDRITLVAKKEGVTLDSDVTRAIARRAHGAGRDAEVLLTQLIGLGEKHITRAQADLVIPRTDSTTMLQLVQAMNDRNLAEALSLIDRIAHEGVHMGEYMNELIELVRVMIYVKVTGTLTDIEQGDLDDDTAKVLPEKVHTMTIDRLSVMMRTLIERKQSVRTAPLPQMPLELAVLSVILDGQPSDLPATPIRGKHISTSESVHTPSRSVTPEVELPPPPTKKPVEKVAKVVAQSQSTPEATLPLEGVAEKTYSTVTMEHISEAWPTIVQQIHKDHRGLYLVLRSGVPIRSDASGVTLGFPFKLLADQAASDRCQKVLSSVVEEVMHLSVHFNAEVVSRSELEKHEDVPATAPEPASGLSQILESLGGEVVGEE